MTELEEAKELNSAKGQEFEKTIETLSEKIDHDNKKMDELKKKLYNKFGGAINLDES